MRPVGSSAIGNQQGGADPIGAKGRDVGTTVAVEIADVQIGDRIAEPGPQVDPRPQSAVSHLPGAGNDAEQIGFMITVEVSESKIGNFEAGGIDADQWGCLLYTSDAADE